jgi:mannan endo-1,4-beta-mannosidase
MKKIFFCIIISVFPLVFVPGQGSTDNNSGLSDIVRTREGIIEYFNTCIENNRIIVGQHCSDNGLLNTYEIYDTYFENLYKNTGKYPALLGNDYGMKSTIRYAEINSLIIKHWEAGGLVTLSWHADCPWFDGYNAHYKASEYKSVIDLTQLLKDAPESAAKTSYRKELLAVGEALKQLKEVGVIVLWRPFHEMNGVGFWWCVDDLKNPANQDDYEDLWRDMYNTYTYDLELDNLIWVYSSHFSCIWASSVSAMYPGDDVVDVVGVDIYTDVPTFNDYEELKQYNKPVVITEIGPSENTHGIYDEREIIRTYSGKAAYFLQWHSWEGAEVAIIDNLYFYEMMNDPSAVTLDDILMK